MPLPAPTSSTTSPGHTAASIALLNAVVRTRSQIIERCTSNSAYIGSGACLIGVRISIVFRRLGALQPRPRRGAQALSVPEDVGSRREVFDTADKLVAGPLVEGLRLKVVGEVHGLRASTRGCLGLGGRQEPRSQPATSQARFHPEVLELAAVAPGPPADARDDLAVLSHEDRQLGSVAESDPGGSIAADLRFEELEVEGVRMILDLEFHRAA